MSENLWTVISFLNQGGEIFGRYAWGWMIQSSVLLAILLGLECLVRKHTRAIFRYGLWLLILVKLILPPTLSLPSGVGYWVNSPQAVSTTNHSKVSLDRPQQVTESRGPAASVESKSLPTVHNEAGQVGPRQATESQASTTSLQSKTLSNQEIAVTAITPSPLSFRGQLFLGWLVGITAFLGLLITKLFLIRRLNQSGQTPAGRLMTILDQARTQVDYQGFCRMILTDALPSPAVCGLFRPVILVPTELKDISEQDLKMALVHELVHIKRHDLWVNALQTLLTMLHFYNPAIWIANVIIRQLCEEAVDETVVSLEGDIEPYSHALINISERVSQKTSLGLSLVSVMESRKAVHRRIKHMWTHAIPKRIRIGAFGIMAISILGAILLPMVHGAQTPAKEEDPNAFHLLVLDDCDPYYRGKDKATYGDRLYMFGNHGRLEAAITGFNRGQSGSSGHRLVVDEQRKTLWVSAEQLWHFDLSTGRLIQKIPDINGNALAIDPATGNAWVLFSENIGEGHIKVVSPSGHIIARHDIPGGDIAYSHYDKQFWVVGKNVYKISLQGTITSKITGQIPWTARSVSIDQDNGNAWIVIGYHFQVQGSQPQLWIVNQDGETVKKTIAIEDVYPYCVTVDSNHGNVWVGCLGTTLRFNTEGKKLQSARGATGFSIALFPTKKMVFSAGDGIYFSRWLDDGRVNPYPVGYDVLSESRQKWIATISFSNAKLKSSPELETMIQEE